MNLPALQKTHSNLPHVLSQEELDIVRQNYAKDATDSEFKMFLGICNHLKLDPFKNEVYFAKFNGKVSVMTSINGLRNKAIETGLWGGRTMPQFCGEDGVWKEIWPHKYPPFACKVGVKKIGFDEPQYAIAEYDAYAKQYNGKSSGLWANMGNHMLAKCAEALAIRIAFSTVTHGMYISEEIGKVKNFTKEEKDFVVKEITKATENYGLKEEELRNIRIEVYKQVLDKYRQDEDINLIKYNLIAYNLLPAHIKNDFEESINESEVEDVEF